LVDVADEVQDEFQGFVAGAEGVGGVEEEGCLFGPCVKNRVCCVSWACIYIHTWLDKAEITQPCTGLQSRSKSRLQLSGGLSFASAVSPHQQFTSIKRRQLHRSSYQ
jgi:hypothetical protein